MRMQGMKNDIKDDKTRWELIPLDCLEDIARVFTEGAKKYDDNSWQNLENGYERYKGALLRHLYASEHDIFDTDTGCRHLAQVAVNAIFLLWISKHSDEYQGVKLDNPFKREVKKNLIDVLDNIESKESDIKTSSIVLNHDAEQVLYKYKFNNKAINKAIKESGLTDVKISYSPILNWDNKVDKSDKYIYNLAANDENKSKKVHMVNLLRGELINELLKYKELYGD